MTIKFTFSADAQRMLHDADERWISEHGYTDNSLFHQIEHARDLLLDNPELGIGIPQDGRLRGVVRRLLLGSSWHLYYRYENEQLIEILGVLVIAGLSPEASFARSMELLDRSAPEEDGFREREAAHARAAWASVR